MQVGSVKEEAEDEYGWLTASGVHCPGRIVLNVWRLMRSGGLGRMGARLGGRLGGWAEAEPTQMALQSIVACINSCMTVAQQALCFHTLPKSLCAVPPNSDLASWAVCTLPGTSRNCRPFQPPITSRSAGWLAHDLQMLVPRSPGAEVKLNIYSLESCAAAVLQLRVPHVPQRQLAAWFSQGPSGREFRGQLHRRHGVPVEAGPLHQHHWHVGCCQTVATGCRRGLQAAHLHCWPRHTCQAVQARILCTTS